MLSQDSLDEAGWNLKIANLPHLPDYERRFLEIELQRHSRAIYRKRVHEAGFSRFSRVLDAGCGVGQWAACLAETGAFVTGVDLSDCRLKTAMELVAHEPWRARVNFVQSSVTNLPVETSSIDLVFCYGTLMLTNSRGTLNEFQRVLKRGGIMYVNVSTYLWYIVRLFTANGHRKSSAVALFNGFMGRGNNSPIAHGRMLRELRDSGFQVLYFGAEGTCGLRGLIPVNERNPFYESGIFGLPYVREYICVKQ